MLAKTRAADDEVVTWLQVRTKLPLIEANAFGEIGRTGAEPVFRCRDVSVVPC